MIIQNTPHMNQAAQPDMRANGAAPARLEPSAPARDAPAQPSVEELKSAVTVINKVMQLSNHSLEFSVDTDTHRTVVKMVDSSTGELIRQYPSETTLAISREIHRVQQGLLLTQKA